jgi:hypothetical protein
VGTWQYTIAFTQGSNVAVNGGGTPLAPYHGLTGTFEIGPTDKAGNDLRAKGRLQYVGERYLRFAGSGEYFLKVGADAPETLLAYSDFDGAYSQKGDALKTYAAHMGDWRPGDPTWQGGKGKGLIGALNYLASEGQNAFSFLTYNAGGDGKNVWPFLTHEERLRYDVSRLDQWNIVFDHADRLGLYLHFKTQETENDNGEWGLDGGDLGLERKLYYRELIARFGYHLALNWNLGEENSQTTEQRQAMAQFIHDLDPYDHHIVVHTYPGTQDDVYTPLLGNASQLTGASLQNAWDATHGRTLKWINESRAAGKPWVVANDEQGNAGTGVPPDLGYQGYEGTSVSQDDIRHQTLWGNLMAGGAGVEYYFGYQQPCNDLDCEDWRSRDRMWNYNRHAVTFFRQHLPFWVMENRNDLIGNDSNEDGDGYVLAKEGEVYAIYLPDGDSKTLDLRDAPAISHAVRWYDPRNGGALQLGSVAAVLGGGPVELGDPPGAADADWVVLVVPGDGTATPPPGSPGQSSVWLPLIRR